MVLSVELRNNHVYLVEANVSKSSIQILKSHHFEFPDAWISEAGIVEPVEFSRRLNKELTAMNFKSKKAFVCLNNNSILYRELTLPKVEPKRLPLLVRSEMMSSLNLTPNYVMDHVELEEVKVEGNTFLRVLAVAILNTVLESTVKTLIVSRLKLKSIDSATNAIIKLVSASGIAEKDEQVIVADVGLGYLRLYLFDAGQYILARNTKLTPYLEESRSAVINSVEENLNKMIQYSYTRNTQREITKIYITGQDELLTDVQQKILESHDMSCQILEYPRLIKGKIEKKFVNSVGTLIRR